MPLLTVIQKEHKELSEMLQTKERKLTEVFLQKEQELQKQLKQMQTKLEEAQREDIHRAYIGRIEARTQGVFTLDSKNTRT